MVSKAYESPDNGDPFDGALKPEEFKVAGEIRTAHVFDPLVREDGIASMHPLLSSMLLKTFDRRNVEFGTSQYPANLYGSGAYQTCPEIGAVIQKES